MKIKTDTAQCEMIKHINEICSIDGDTLATIYAFVYGKSVIYDDEDDTLIVEENENERTNMGVNC